MPVNHRPLNHHQVRLLQTLYKFRFTTTQLIAQSQSINKRVIQSRLTLLVQQEYLGQNYDNSYKLTHRPATYYLRLEAVRYLRKQPYANTNVISSIYHDKRASDSHIAHCLQVFTVYVAFKGLYKENMKFLSKSELAGRAHFPKELPDAYIELLGSPYLLMCVTESMRYGKLVYQVRQLVAYAESDEWKKRFSTLPVMLVVADKELVKRRMRRIISQELDKSYALLSFLLTTTGALENITKQDEAIWSNVTQPSKVVNLNNL